MVFDFTPLILVCGFIANITGTFYLCSEISYFKCDFLFFFLFIFFSYLILLFCFCHSANLIIWLMHTFANYFTNRPCLPNYCYYYYKHNICYKPNSANNPNFNRHNIRNIQNSNNMITHMTRCLIYCKEWNYLIKKWEQKCWLIVVIN